MCSDNITSDCDIPDLDSENNEDVDSALAEVASPAPASVAKKSRRRESVAKLWEFDEGEDIPDLEVQATDEKGADPVVFRLNSCDKQEGVDTQVIVWYC